MELKFHVAIIFLQPYTNRVKEIAVKITPSKYTTYSTFQLYLDIVYIGEQINYIMFSLNIDRTHSPSGDLFP